MRRTRVAGASMGAVVLAGGLIAGGLIAVGLSTGCSSGRQLTVDPTTYEATVRAFYTGLAHLQVGLLTDAREEFASVTELVPDEPAGWANLALAQMRLGSFEDAEAPAARAAGLAPDSAAVALLQGRMESSVGNLEAALRHFEHAVELAPTSIRARYALAQEAEDAGGDGADGRAQAAIEALLELAPDNLAAGLERARLAAKRQDLPALRAAVADLGTRRSGWSPAAFEQYDALRAAAEAGDTRAAARGTAFLRNVLSPTPVFQESLLAVSTAAELIVEPFERFLRLPTPVAAPSPRDEGLTYEPQVLDEDESAAGARTSIRPLFRDETGGFALWGVDSAGHVGPLASPATAGPVTLSTGVGVNDRDGLLPVDWNADFELDLVVAGPDGVRLLLQQDDGRFEDRTPESGGTLPSMGARGAWAADIEMDGDIDIVLGLVGEATVVLRNNGDGTWTLQDPFATVSDLAAFAWGDLDRDGDPDAAMLGGDGRLHLFVNRQGGQFEPMAGPAAADDLLAMTIGDLDADGRFDLVAVHGDGRLRRHARDGVEGAWTSEDLASWDVPADAQPGAARVFLADLDNNGALDVLASVAGSTGVWLAGEDLALVPAATPPDGEVFDLADLNGDGWLDLVGRQSARAVRWLARGSVPYHWQVLRPRAQLVAGDQRINTFGIGGEMEARSGLMVQRQVIAGPAVHLGLGARTAVDVTRIVWPNGIMQAEFGPDIDRVIAADQRLKGSCPWVFTYDGTGMQFVTDFLWRSPLGLRINAQDTAGVTQTEDWIRIRGDQLVPRDGRYDVRVTAELWETHFVDYTSLLVVDHPVGTEILVDERFAPEAPPLQVETTSPLRPVAGAWDERGQDVSALVQSRDARYLDTFDLGRYQGVAADHWVELAIDGRDSSDPGDLRATEAPGGSPQWPRWLVAGGWVYPTDSSINVALGQGRHAAPTGLSLEVQDQSGTWLVAATDLGFPAGKQKTILLDLHALLQDAIVTKGADLPGDGSLRLRLRTNLEVYWDFIATANAVDASVARTTRVRPETAELRFRGFSVTSYDRDGANRRGPELPRYDELANVTPRWRDLEGYYTRFGEVGPLLEQTDDRYVIMNAGDELRLQFPVPPMPGAAEGSEEWVRDFVLIGDGWVKDGDFNTSFSRTVLPLPTHARADYGGGAAEPTLADDPVYRTKARDWQRYHTRYVTPRRYLSGLSRSGPETPSGHQAGGGRP